MLKVPLPFLKTSDPITTLRPPDLVALEEIGDVVKIRSFDTVEIRFRRGTFLVPINHISKVD